MADVDDLVVSFESSVATDDLKKICVSRRQFHIVLGS
jgi:hypothetical protein